MFSEQSMPSGMQPQETSGWKTFSPKDQVLIDDNSLWMIQQGIVRTATWNEDAVGITLGFWGEGDIIGHPLSQVQPYVIECLTPVVIRPVVGADPLVNVLINHSRHNEVFIDLLHQPYVRSRLVLLLEWLAQRFGSVTPKGHVLDLSLTHQELADTIGATRVTITRLINQLEQDGKIRRSGRSLYVHGSH